jgi:endonuclease/exonuclease/phosphatase (EEP) superfamily protein YafD
MKRMLGRPLIAVIGAAILVAGVLFCTFTPDVFVFKQGANFTVQIMLGYFAFGMLMLILRREFLMYTSLACCAALCIYLKSASNQHLRFPNPTDAPKITCALINLSLSDDFEATMETIRKADADVVAFQEFTPDWDDVLNSDIAGMYPFRAVMTRIDPYGMAWFSKRQILLSDTFAYAGIPNLLATIEVQPDVRMHLISVHTRVPADASAYRDIKRHLFGVSEYMESLDDPAVVVGDLNLPSWTTEVMQFKLDSRLSDSRRDIIPASVQGNVSFFKVPVDHIFFSRELECTGFQAIAAKGDNHLGIIGTYQLKVPEEQSREQRVKQ